MEMIIWKNVVVMAVILLSNSSVSSANVIHQIVKGNLSGPWKMNFTIFANDFSGMILYSVDSYLNKISIKVIIGVNSKKYVQLSHNNVFTRTSTNQLCGCDPCNDKLINFTLEFQNRSIGLGCNDFGRDSLKESWIKDNIPQLILQKIKDQNNSIVIGMGNVDGTEDLVGCLKSFYFNNSRIKFKEIGTEFLSICPLKCTQSFCNKGKCIERHSLFPICDCSGTALNGRHCSRPLKEYKKSSSMIFQRIWTTKHVQFKVSWQQRSDETYCLMDVIYKSGNFTLTINGDYLMKDTEVVTPISPGNINFINVNITESRVIIKSADKVFVIEKSLLETVRVNFGFSEKISNCKTFVGTYDFNFNTSQLERIAPPAFVPSKVNVKWIILPLLFVIILICLIVLLIFIQRKRQLPRNVETQESSKLEFDEGMELKSEAQTKL